MRVWMVALDRFFPQAGCILPAGSGQILLAALAVKSRIALGNWGWERM